MPRTHRGCTVGSVPSRLLAALAAALALACLPAATADARVTGDWGYYAAVSSRFDVPLPDVYVHRGGCPEYVYGDWRPPCSSPETREVWIPDGAGRFALAHELGHQFDEQYLTDPDRAWLRRLMRAPRGDWWRPSGAGEWFADYYADCAIGLGRTSREGYASRPSPLRLQRVCNAIAVWGLTR